MRRKKIEKIDTVIERILTQSELGTRLKELRIIKSWTKILGKSIQQNTNNIYINNRTLFVYVNSSVIKHQLTGLSDSLIEMLNAEVDAKIIDKIVIRNR